MDNDKRHSEMMKFAAENMATNSSLSVASEIRTFLMTIKDEGTSIDAGGGMGEGDLWVKIGGIEYFITVRKSNNQIAKDQGNG